MTRVSFVVPARNESEYIGDTLSSIDGQRTDESYEVIVADGGSVDGTTDIAREHGADVVQEGGQSIAGGRNAGAEAAEGEWLAFIDADTRIDPAYLETMLSFVDREGLVAASSKCRMTGPARARLVEWTINHVFPRLAAPVLPGFNTFVRRDIFEAVGGYPDVPNEDTAFSRTLGQRYPTGYHPDGLVESSGRRVADSGLTGTLYHYLRLDWGRLRSDRGRDIVK
ncbi:glycosyltransferase [Natronomonas halophila]|uniref:glycosyltransferase n=1 Tax=Natronomonas halophila TaxID=2747817 RepID=UPI0015B77DE1|nr:glycosyltransferase [Natronomonas halophila]QLD84926.1 glycosyltransferase [Natronomonas halophila]